MVSQTQPQSFLKETLGAEPRAARRNERNSLCMRRESEAEPQSRVATREIPCFFGGMMFQSPNAATPFSSLLYEA